MRAPLIVTCCICLATGCGESGSTAADLTKHQARRIDRGRWEGDYCAARGWYGDGECDDFCPDDDQDCDPELEARAQSFLDAYVSDYAEKERALGLANWETSTTGDPEAYQAYNNAQIDAFMLHVDPQRQQELKDLLVDRARLALWTRRSLEVAEPSFMAVDVPVEELGKLLKIVQLRNEASDLYSSYKVELQGDQYTTNELQEMLAKEQDPSRRKMIWEAVRQVGAAVAPKIVEGIQLANEVAASLGCSSYWECAMRMGDQDPQEMVALFDEVAELTEQPYARIKADIDGEVAARFGIDPDRVMIWHYDDPFFQSPPPSPEVALDLFFEGMDSASIVDTAVDYFDRLGFDVSAVVARSDLYERDGKWPGAFMTDIDRGGDIRILLNTRPSHRWMSTALHELGHAVDHQLVEPDLPFLLRTANHTLTTEAVAMMFGNQSQRVDFLTQVAGADPGQVQPLETSILEHYRRGELVFTRFALVMFHFEKMLYEDPDRDLNTLWWDLVEQFQLVQRPADRQEPDWACKTHIASSPVYYHNYLLGMLFGAQLRAFLAQETGHAGPALDFSFLSAPDAVDILRTRLLRIGKDLHWWELVTHATGAPLEARHFAEQVGQPPS